MQIIDRKSLVNFLRFSLEEFVQCSDDMLCTCEIGVFHLWCVEETDRIILKQEIAPFIFDKTQEGDNKHDVALQHEHRNFDAHHGIYASISMKFNHK